MEKTLSKNWYDHEIKGIMWVDGKKVIYLKSNVKRLWRFNDYLVENQIDHINKQRIHQDKIEEYYTKVIGSENYLENN